MTGGIGLLSGLVREGEVSLAATEAEVDLDLEDSPLRGAALVSPVVRVQGTTGNVSLQFADRPVRVEVASQGSVSLQVPAGRYALDLTSDLGTVSVQGVQADPQAGAALVANTRLGSVVVVGE